MLPHTPIASKVVHQLLPRPSLHRRRLNPKEQEGLTPNNEEKIT